MKETFREKGNRYSMKKIVLTGGGTAGHVTPNIALLPALKALSYEIEYIGSYQGMEKDLIEAIIALPTDLFYNTGIQTYVWILSKNKRT